MRGSRYNARARNNVAICPGGEKNNNKKQQKYITARISPKQRESVTLYNESIADSENIINEADRLKIK